MPFFSSNESAAAGENIKQREEKAPPPANESIKREEKAPSSVGSTSPVVLGAVASGDEVADVSDIVKEEEKPDADVDADADVETDKKIEGPGPLTREEQDKVAEDVNELFKVIHFFMVWCRDS